MESNETYGIFYVVKDEACMNFRKILSFMLANV